MDLVACGLLGLSLDSASGAAAQFFVLDAAKVCALLVIVIHGLSLLHALLSPERVRGSSVAGL